MIGIVENGMRVRTWGIQRDVTEKAKLEESRRRAEPTSHQNVAQLQAVTEELREAKERKRSFPRKRYIRNKPLTPNLASVKSSGEARP